MNNDLIFKFAVTMLSIVFVFGGYVISRDGYEVAFFTIIAALVAAMVANMWSNT